LLVPYNRDSGLGVRDWGFETPWAGGWGIRALKDSPAMKGLDFCRMCRRINAFGKVREGIRQKKMLEKIRWKPLCV